MGELRASWAVWVARAVLLTHISTVGGGPPPAHPPDGYCFKMHENNGVAHLSYPLVIASNSNSICQYRCYLLAQIYAATQGDVCRCENTVKTNSMDPGTCNFNCLGNDTQTCGGSDSGTFILVPASMVEPAGYAEAMGLMNEEPMNNTNTTTNNNNTTTNNNNTTTNNNNTTTNNNNTTTNNNNTTTNNNNTTTNNNNTTTNNNSNNTTSDNITLHNH
ncbi:M protein, serotype 6-like, partial [Homarus americanus]